MIEAEEIVAELIAFFQPKLLKGKKILLTAGPTFEAIDPVRGIPSEASYLKVVYTNKDRAVPPDMQGRTISAVLNTRVSARESVCESASAR